MATKNQITGGAFQDALGNVVANGFMIFQLSQDAQVNGTTQLGAGREITINLDSNGNVAATQSLWPNDVLSPANTFYNVSVYTANGQLVWGPNPQQVLSTPSPFNIGAWVPASVNVSSGGGGGGGGSVTSVSVVTANGFSGTVANATTTPAITISPAGFLAQDNNWTAEQTFSGGWLSGGDVSIVTPNASSGSGNQNSPQLLMVGSYWDGTASQLDTWSFQVQPSVGSNPTVTLELTHSGTPGQVDVNLQYDVFGNSFNAANGDFSSNLIGTNVVVEDSLELINNVAATPSANSDAATLTFQSSYWNGTLSVPEQWLFEVSLGTGISPTSTLTLSHMNNTGVAMFHVPNLNLDAAVIASTATAGSATLPANPLGFWETIINGTSVKIPYYAA
jgi:hypothetical protein